MDWASKELSSLSLGDNRLNNRGKKILSQLSDSPTDSIPLACRGAAETKAAYRFLSNPSVTPEEIHASHVESTLARISREEVVLVAQDTTVLNFTSQAARTDTGPTVSDASRGIYLHTSLAMTPEKVSLGVLSVTQWYREALQKLTRSERAKKDFNTPIEEKESHRWIAHMSMMNEHAKRLPNTLFVNLADREGDIYDLYMSASKDIAPNAHYLIRAQHNRKLCTEEGKRTEERIKESLRKDGYLGEFCLDGHSMLDRGDRAIDMKLYAKEICIKRPAHQKQRKEEQHITLTAILCSENSPSDEESKLEWLLLTDLKVNDFVSAYEKVSWYCCRWQIEIFFKTLKSGCKIEKLQLTDAGFSVCLRFYMIIAWRILYITMLGREAPDMPCDCVFSQEEWETTHVVLFREKPPKTPPSLNDMVRNVARLGGYLNRKSDPPPGTKVLWLGLRNMQEHLIAREAFFETYGKTYG